MPKMEPPRILIVQDREDTLDYQIRNFRRVAQEYGGARVDAFDLKDEHESLLNALKSGARWYDWIVADLLEDDLDVDALSSSGMKLLRRIRADGQFHAYAPRAPAPSGIRCVTVNSAVFGDGGFVGAQVGEELRRLGVKVDWLVPIGDAAALARRIFESLAGEGLCSRSAEQG